MRILLALALMLTGALIAAAAFVYAGFYDVSATRQHLAPTYRLLEVGMRESLARHTRDIEVPPLDDARLRESGLAQYREHCVRCHGAPGVAPEPYALGMTPTPANLAHTARVWTPAELYWTVKYGLKMTGMPAWAFRLTDDEIWAIVAFLRVMPALSPGRYRELAARAARPAAAAQASAATAPDAVRGRDALVQYACLTCHSVPGIVGRNAPVGPPLENMGRREFIAGVLPNSLDNMVLWLRAPQSVSPQSAMPDLGVNERDARDIAAFLSTLR